MPGIGHAGVLRGRKATKLQPGIYEFNQHEMQFDRCFNGWLGGSPCLRQHAGLLPAPPPPRPRPAPGLDRAAAQAHPQTRARPSFPGGAGGRGSGGYPPFGQDGAWMQCFVVRFFESFSPFRLPAPALAFAPGQDVRVSLQKELRLAQVSLPAFAQLQLAPRTTEQRADGAPRVRREEDGAGPNRLPAGVRPDEWHGRVRVQHGL